MTSVKHVIAILLVILYCGKSYSQNDSCSLTISLITCGPGEELYSVFGHTAIRIKDGSNYDIIYNYGTFDFEDPEFYSKFVKGKLIYFVSAENFNRFMYEYQMENRSVVEQELNLRIGQPDLFMGYVLSSDAPLGTYTFQIWHANSLLVEKAFTIYRP